MPSSSTITVKGKGFASIPPDFVRIELSLTGIEKNYNQALQKAAERLEQLHILFTSYELGRKDIKTKNFSVDTSYEYLNEITGEQKRVLAGYRYQHDLYVEFSRDQEKLGEILESLAESTAKPEFSVRFKLNDRRKIEQQMLESAFQDALSKAEILARASGCRLGNISQIQYDWKDVEVFSPLLMRSQAGGPSHQAAAVSLEPEEIKNSDTVTVVWELEKRDPKQAGD